MFTNMGIGGEPTDGVQSRGRLDALLCISIAAGGKVLGRAMTRGRALPPLFTFAVPHLRLGRNYLGPGRIDETLSGLIHQQEPLGARPFANHPPLAAAATAFRFALLDPVTEPEARCAGEWGE